jgi:adenosylcobyric acid synthase
MNMAKAIMIQGTGSGAGKSVIVAGLCRIFRDMGIKVAPFKAQNMALNSFITKEGGEIGRAQAFQAEAAGIEPHNDINPVLLKARSEAGCQVILDGKVYANMKADEYYDIKEKAWKHVTDAYDRLAKEYDLIVIEGAGSPAEINLREEEIVNMKVARYTDAPVMLVGDIDKGGVFASFYGTVGLLKDHAGENGHSPSPETDEKTDADYIKAFIVNKFRGDINILRPGLRQIEDKTGKPVIGVLNYQGDLGLHEEDAIPVERLIPRHRGDYHKPVKIVVLGLRYISNFTDFDPFMYEPDVELKYSLDEMDIKSADLIIVPGSKNTVTDLLFLRENGIDDLVRAAAESGTTVAGICGGYQMLGSSILDPHGVESSHRKVEGIGLLDVETTLDRTKTTCQISANLISNKWFDAVKSTSACKWNQLKGYEIHMGHTTGDVGLFKIKRLDGPNEYVPDGSARGNVWGTYIHGIFDNDGLRTSVINSLRMKKGLSPREGTVNYHAKREEAINRWADILGRSVDICFILREVGMEQCMNKLPEDLK